MKYQVYGEVGSASPNALPDDHDTDVVMGLMYDALRMRGKGAGDISAKINRELATLTAETLSLSARLRMMFKILKHASGVAIVALAVRQRPERARREGVTHDYSAQRDTYKAGPMRINR